MFEYETDVCGTDVNGREADVAREPAAPGRSGGATGGRGAVPEGLPGGLGELAGAVATLSGEELGGLGPGGRDDRVVVLARLVERAGAELVRSVGAWDGAGDWAFDGSLRAAASLASRTRLGRREAGRLVRAARLAREHPEVGDALREGRVSTGQVDRLVRAVGRGREGLFARDVEMLVDAAAGLDVDEFDRVVRRWELLADDELERDPPAAVDPDVKLSPTEGGWFLSGGLDPETGELLTQALEAAVPPDAATRAGGVRSAGQRRAEGLRILAESFLARPVPGRVIPRLVVHVTVDALVRDTTVPFDLARLRADLERGGPIPIPTLERLACDPHLVRVVFAGPGQVLEVGRASRVVTDAQRRALEARDGCCQWPGCDRPASWCDAHHIVPWAGGGPTDLENLVLLCPAHHRLLHDERWNLERDPTTGHVTVTPHQPGTRRPGPSRTHDPPEP